MQRSRGDHESILELYGEIALEKMQELDGFIIYDKDGLVSVIKSFIEKSSLFDK